MLHYFTLILVCQLVGELLTTALRLPVPGPVIGMVLLFGFLIFRGKIPAALAQTSDALLGNLSLLFVPAGVGVMLHFKLLEADMLPIGIALIVSTVLTIAVTALLMTWFGRRTKTPAADGE